MNSLLPISATPFERNVAQASMGIDDIPIPLRDLWNPDKCPIRLLPYLAWAFSVDRWDENWSDAEKRKAVNDAFYIHRRKGTVAAIRRVIENMGYAMSITEWWQVADPAGTFRLTIDVNDVGITDEIVNELERLIGDARPVSRHIAHLTISTKVLGNAWVGVITCDGEIMTTYPQDYEPDDSIYYDGITVFNGNFYFSGDSNEQN
ncbi:Phage tail protein [compost metagenome]